MTVAEGGRVAQLLRCRTRDQKVARLKPSRSSEKIFFPKVNFLCPLILCLFHPYVTAVAPKRPKLFCQKCWQQVTPKHTYTFDQMKSEWADYAVLVKCGDLSGKQFHTQLVTCPLWVYSRTNMLIQATATTTRTPPPPLPIPTAAFLLRGGGSGGADFQVGQL